MEYKMKLITAILLICILFFFDFGNALDYCTKSGSSAWCPAGYHCCDLDDGSCCANGYFCTGSAVCIGYWVIIVPVVGIVTTVVVVVVIYVLKKKARQGQVIRPNYGGANTGYTANQQYGGGYPTQQHSGASGQHSYPPPPSFDYNAGGQKY